MQLSKAEKRLDLLPQLLISASNSLLNGRGLIDDFAMLFIGAITRQLAAVIQVQALQALMTARHGICRDES
jgi:hypothetical protein